MVIELDKCSFDYGAYGLVAFVKNKTKAVKIFKKTHSYEQANNVFKSEVKAYELAQASERVKSLVPNFYGEVIIDNVLDEDGNDISDRFYLSMAYTMSFEEGTFRKISLVSEIEYNRIRADFVGLGINYFKDSSVTVDKNGSINKIIDFATQEFELWA